MCILGELINLFKASSYKRLINNVFDQRQKCISMANTIYNRKGESWKSAIEKAHKIMKYDVIYNKHYSLPTYWAIIDGVRKPKNGNKKSIATNILIAPT